MEITLSNDVELLIQEQVRRGSYPNAEEAVSDAIRKTFAGVVDLEQDTPELAALMREALVTAHTPYKKGDLHRAVEKIRSEHAK